MSLSLRQLAETAALASSRANLVIESSSGISDTKLQDYWTNCRSRCSEWFRKLDTFSSRLNSEPSENHQSIWQELEPLLNEVFVSEILTRVWAAVLTASDQRRDQKLAGPIARHTVSSHIEARHRAMTLMVDGPQISLTELARVDRVRRKAERWTDLLLGHLILNYGMHELAFEPDRATDFAQSQVREIVRATDEPVWEFVQVGIRLAFNGLAGCNSPSENWNRGVLRSVIGSFPIDMFDEYGLTKSTMRTRIERGNSMDRALERNASDHADGRETTTPRLSFAALRQRHPKDS